MSVACLGTPHLAPATAMRPPAATPAARPTRRRGLPGQGIALGALLGVGMWYGLLALVIG